MRVMVMVKATTSSEAGEMPGERLLTEMGQYNEALVNAGIMQAGEGLHPSSKGFRVRFSGKDRTVIDGPFAETKELVAGFWMWRVTSMEEAIAWVKRCPNPHEEDCEIEIRQVFEAEDFGETFTPELREQEASLRAQTLGLIAPRFEEGAALRIAGLNETHTFETRMNIPKQWERFAPLIGKVPGQVGSTSYGVCWNYAPGRGFDYLTGVAVMEESALPPGFQEVRLAKSRYVVLTHRGPISGIGETLDTIWTKWVPDCGLKLAQAPCFERYTEKFDPQTGSGDVEFWIALAG